MSELNWWVVINWCNVCLSLKGLSGGHSSHSSMHYGHCPLPLASVTQGKCVQQRSCSQSMWNL